MARIKKEKPFAELLERFVVRFGEEGSERLALLAARGAGEALLKAYLGDLPEAGAPEQIAPVAKKAKRPKKDDRQIDLFGFEAPAPKVGKKTAEQSAQSEELAVDDGANIWVHYAAEGGNGKELLARAKSRTLSRSLMEKKNRHGKTMLHAAAMGDDAAGVEAYASAGGNLNDKTADGSSALHLAAWAGSATAMRALLDLGANLNAQDDEGMTPLMCACMAAEYACALALMKAEKIDFAVLDRKGKTCLHYAAEGASQELFDALASAGAYEDHEDNLGRTPLDCLLLRLGNEKNEKSSEIQMQKRKDKRLAMS